jgi:hypothetical protein
MQKVKKLSVSISIPLYEKIKSFNPQSTSNFFERAGWEYIKKEEDTKKAKDLIIFPPINQLKYLFGEPLIKNQLKNDRELCMFLVFISRNPLINRSNLKIETVRQSLYPQILPETSITTMFDSLIHFNIIATNAKGEITLTEKGKQMLEFVYKEQFGC